MAKAETVRPKIIKTTASSFPSFDGLSDYEVWKDNWKTLASNSGLNEECLVIKLRESIKGEAEKYMGETGMRSLGYHDMWVKLQQRYSLPWTRAQAASRKLLALDFPSSERQTIYDYVNGIRETIDACLRAGLTLESLCLNICLDHMPPHVKGPLNDKLTRIKSSFLFDIDTFEKEFSSVMSLTSNATEQIKSARIAAYNIGKIEESKPRNEKGGRGGGGKW